MPRRRRVDKRRTDHDQLDLLVVLGNTNVRGCRAIPDDVTLDDLYGVWSQLTLSRGDTWAHRAFVKGVPRPCEGLKVPSDPFDLDKGRKMRCLPGKCRFDHEPQP